MEGPAHQVARLFRGDWTLRTEYRLTILALQPSFARGALGDAPVDVLMPPRDGEGNARVELVVAEPLGRGVHRAHQHELPVGLLRVEERRRPRGIEAEGLLHGAPAVGEVVDL